MNSTTSSSNLSHNNDALLTKLELRDALHLPSTRMVDELMRKRLIPFIRLGHKTVRFSRPKVMAALSRLEVHAVGDERE